MGFRLYCKSLINLLTSQTSSSFFFQFNFISKEGKKKLMKLNYSSSSELKFFTTFETVPEITCFQFSKIVLLLIIKGKARPRRPRIIAEVKIIVGPSCQSQKLESGVIFRTLALGERLEGEQRRNRMTRAEWKKRVHFQR